MGKPLLDKCPICQCDDILAGPVIHTCTQCGRIWVHNKEGWEIVPIYVHPDILVNLEDGEIKTKYMKRRPKDLSPELKERIQALFDEALHLDPMVKVDFEMEYLRVYPTEGPIWIPMDLLDKMLAIMHNDCVTVKPEKKKRARVSTKKK